MIKFVDFLENVSIILICMDMRKSSLAADSGDLKQLASHRVVVGAKQLRKALSRGTARHAYLARNADPAITEPLAQMCREACVEVTWVDPMARLGSACGIEVGATTATRLD